MYEDKQQSELNLTNDITPFDSSEETKEELEEETEENDYEIQEVKAQKVYSENLIMCEKCFSSGIPDSTCPYYEKCPYFKNDIANTIINKFKDFTEVIFYKSNFRIPRCKGKKVEHSVDKTRKWLKDNNGVLSPKNDGTKLEDLQNTITSSRKRALDNMFGYILCNEWDYFVTVTFKHGKFKKLSDEVVKYQWQKFRQQLQYRFPDIKIFLVPEDTPTGVKGMHFHGFMGNADFSEYLRPARNNKKYYEGQPNPQYGEFLYTKFGDPVFNFVKTFVNIGFTTVVKLKDKDKLKLVNYMTKYMHKDSSNFDYNENTYLRTYNLDFKDKKVLLISQEEKEKLVDSIFAECYKQTDKMTVYRIYNQS